MAIILMRLKEGSEIREGRYERRGGEYYPQLDTCQEAVGHVWARKERKGDLQNARKFGKENNYKVYHFPPGTTRNAFNDAKKKFITEMKKKGIKFCRND